LLKPNLIHVNKLLLIITDYDYMSSGAAQFQSQTEDRLVRLCRMFPDYDPKVLSELLQEQGSIARVCQLLEGWLQCGTVSKTINMEQYEIYFKDTFGYCTCYSCTCLSTQEAGVALVCASYNSYASFVLSNLPRATIMWWVHAEMFTISFVEEWTYKVTVF
jgi:hypothetical protein